VRNGHARTQVPFPFLQRSPQHRLAIPHQKSTKQPLPPSFPVPLPLCVCVCVCMYVYVYVYVRVFVTRAVSVCLFVCLPACLPVCLPACLPGRWARRRTTRALREQGLIGRHLGPPALGLDPARYVREGGRSRGAGEGRACWKQAQSRSGEFVRERWGLVETRTFPQVKRRPPAAATALNGLWGGSESLDNQNPRQQKFPPPCFQRTG